MTDIVKEACEAYEQMLINATRYSGNTEPNTKIFSASMLGSDLLQCYFKITNGVIPSNKFSAAELGSIHQLGVDMAVQEAGLEGTAYISRLRLEYPLENGWIISGEIDQYDTKRHVIFDNKMTATKNIKETKKEGKDGQYALQLGVYKFLMSKAYEGEIGKSEIYYSALAMVDKSFSYYRDTKTNQMNYIEVPTYDVNEIEELLYEKTNKLQTFLDLGEEPPECKNLFKFKVPRSNRLLRMRCIHYCGYKDICNYYKKSNKDNYHFTQSLM